MFFAISFYVQFLYKVSTTNKFIMFNILKNKDIFLKVFIFHEKLEIFAGY